MAKIGDTKQEGGRTKYWTISKTGTGYWSTKKPVETTTPTPTPTPTPTAIDPVKAEADNPDPSRFVPAYSPDGKSVEYVHPGDSYWFGTMGYTETPPGTTPTPTATAETAATGTPEEQQTAKTTNFTTWSGDTGGSYKEWKALREGAGITEDKYEDILAKYVDFIGLKPEERAAKYPAITDEINKATDETMGTFFDEVQDDLNKEEAKLLNREKENFDNEMSKIGKDEELDLRAKNDALEGLLNSYKLKVEELDVSEQAKDAAFFDAMKSSENGISNYMQKSGISEEQAVRHTEEFLEKNLREQGYKMDEYDKYISKMTEQHAQRGIAMSGESLKAINEVNEERAREMFELKDAVKSKTADLEDYKKLIDIDRTAALQGLAEKLGTTGATQFLDQEGIQYNPQELQGFKGALTAQREQSEQLLDLARRGIEEQKRTGTTDIARKFETSQTATQFAKSDVATGQARGQEDIVQRAKEQREATAEEEKRTRADVKQEQTEQFFGSKIAPFATNEELFRSFSPTQFFS